MKNSSNPIVNRNHDLSACRAVKWSMDQGTFVWNSCVKYEVRQRAVYKKRVRRYAQLLTIRPFYVFSKEEGKIYVSLCNTICNYLQAKRLEMYAI